MAAELYDLATPAWYAEHRGAPQCADEVAAVNGGIRLDIKILYARRLGHEEDEADAQPNDEGRGDVEDDAHDHHYPNVDVLLFFESLVRQRCIHQEKDAEVDELSGKHDAWDDAHNLKEPREQHEDKDHDTGEHGAPAREAAAEHVQLRIRYGDVACEAAKHSGKSLRDGRVDHLVVRVARLPRDVGKREQVDGHVENRAEQCRLHDGGQLLAELIPVHMSGADRAVEHAHEVDVHLPKQPALFPTCVDAPPYARRGRRSALSCLRESTSGR